MPQQLAQRQGGERRRAATAITESVPAESARRDARTVPSSHRIRAGGHTVAMMRPASALLGTGP